MTKKYDLIIKSAQVIATNASGELVTELTDVGINGKKIAHVGPLMADDGDKVLEAKGLHLLPGLIDSQVHFREPGLEHKEDLATGSLSAVMGGISTYFEMPNTNPPTDSAIAMADKVSRAKGRSWSNFAFFIGGTPDNASRLGELEVLPGCSGVKIFMGSSTGSLLVPEDETLRIALASSQRRVAIHAEDEQRLKQRKPLTEEHRGQPEFHPIWRDEESAILATKRIVKIAEDLNRQVHVLHITTAEELEFLKSKKKNATVECTPQHLSLHSPDCYERLGTKAQMNPPIRDIRHQHALWKAIADGTVDVIGSDHAPHTLEEKAKEYPNTPSGMPGVQTLLPIMLNHVNSGKLSLLRLVQLLSVRPAQIYKAQFKGGILVGNDADFCLIDLNAEKTIEKKWLKYKCGWSPFEGVRVKGWPVATIVGGQIVMRDDEIVGSPRGEAVEFKV